MTHVYIVISLVLLSFGVLAAITAWFATTTAQTERELDVSDVDFPPLDYRAYRRV